MKIQPDLEQVKNLLENHQRILIAVSPRSDLEAMHAAYVLKKTVKAAGKDSVVLLSSETALAAADSGLDLSSGCVGRIAPPPLIVKIPLSKVRLEKVDYATEGDVLKLSVHPSQGKCLPEFIEFETGTLPYSLLITLGIVRLKDLGELYEDYLLDNPEMPIINLDYRKENALYGTINLVYEEATTLTEVVASLVKELGYPLDGHQAQVLMVGLVNKTRGFASDVTPGIFRTAASLNALGAKPQVRLKSIAPSTDITQTEDPIR